MVTTSNLGVSALSSPPNAAYLSTFFCIKKDSLGTSLVVQWLRLGTSNAGGVCLIPSQGNKISHTARHSREKKKKKTLFVSQAYLMVISSFLHSYKPLHWAINYSPASFYEFIYLFLFGEARSMAPHSSTLAWKIPWMEEPGRLQSMGSLRVGHD